MDIALEFETSFLMKSKGDVHEDTCNLPEQTLTLFFYFENCL